jgi:hypothetical protein
MLKASVVRTIPLYRAASALRVSPAPCFLGAISRTSHACLNTLTSNQAREQTLKEGTLRRESQLFGLPYVNVDHPGEPAGANSSPALTKPDEVSTVPTMVRGDWVLFHPVYTPEELKDVEVRLSFGT